MATQGDIDQLLELLQTHRQTLAILLTQSAKIGSLYVRPEVSHGITEARAHISRIKEGLRAWGVAIEDHPNDQESNEPVSGRDLLRDGQKRAVDIHASPIPPPRFSTGYEAIPQNHDDPALVRKSSAIFRVRPTLILWLILGAVVAFIAGAKLISASFAGNPFVDSGPTSTLNELLFGLMIVAGGLYACWRIYENLRLAIRVSVGGLELQQKGKHTLIEWPRVQTITRGKFEDLESLHKTIYRDTGYYISAFGGEIVFFDKELSNFSDFEALLRKHSLEPMLTRARKEYNDKGYTRFSEVILDRRKGLLRETKSKTMSVLASSFSESDIPLSERLADESTPLDLVEEITSDGYFVWLRRVDRTQPQILGFAVNVTNLFVLQALIAEITTNRRQTGEGGDT